MRACFAQPGLPGATSRFARRAEFAQARAKACSRAPEPRIKTFIKSSRPSSFTNVAQRAAPNQGRSLSPSVTMHNAGIFEGLLVFGRTDVALMAKFEFRAGPLHDAFRDNASGQQMGRLDQPSGMAPSTGERPVRLLRAADLQSAWRILRSG